MNTLLSFILGIVASFVAWLLVAQIIRPHVSLSKTIEKGRSFISSDHFVYRIGAANNNWFYKVFDVQIYGKIMIRGLNPDNPNDIKSFMLIIGRGITPYINPFRGNKDNIKKLIVKVPLSKPSQMGQLKKLYCKYHHMENVKHFGLTEVFDISEKLDISMEVSLICCHMFSSARSIAIQTYTKDSIIMASPDVTLAEN